MKKLNLLLAIICTCAITMYGQIKVDQNGKTFLGASISTTSYGSVNVAGNGASNGIALVGGSGSPLRIYKSGSAGYVNMTGNNNGIRIGDNNCILISPISSQYIGYPYDAALNLYGINTTINSRFLYDYPHGDAIKSIVDNSLSNAFTVYLENQGQHEQNFYVRGEGTVYAKNGYIQSSDISNKTEVTNLSSALNRITSLRAVSFNYKDIATRTRNILSRYKSLPSDSLSPHLSLEVAEQMEKEVNRKRIGLIAQEVEEVVPEVVRTLPDGKKGIMYSDLVGLLVEGIKELRDSLEVQSQQTNDLQRQLDEIKVLITGISSDDFISFKKKINSGIKNTTATLYQNTPNPFNQETEIRYQVPLDASASICIYNLSGQQLKKYPLVDINGKIVVSASELTAGIYIYSLIVNNREVDSKRMVLTD